MGIKDIIKKSVLEGFASQTITLRTAILCIVCTAAIACYIYFVYKLINKNSFYNKNFNLSLIVVSAITASIILTIQSNLVVSLGMVGALSIVRFRTAVKDPMDLAFMFWSISVGIISGAGYAAYAVIASAAITLIIVVFSFFNNARTTDILIVNSDSIDKEKKIIDAISAETKRFYVRSRNASMTSLNMAIEVKTIDQRRLLKSVLEVEGVTNVSLVEHDGEVTP